MRDIAVIHVTSAVAPEKKMKKNPAAMAIVGRIFSFYPSEVSYEKIRNREVQVL